MYTFSPCLRRRFVVVVVVGFRIRIFRAGIPGGGLGVGGGGCRWSRILLCVHIMTLFADYSCCFRGELCLCVHSLRWYVLSVYITLLRLCASLRPKDLQSNP